jgi:hypothetical protein
MGMLASISNNTKISTGTFALFLRCCCPPRSSGPANMTAAEMRKALVFQSINPIDAITKFLGRVLVLDAPPGEHWLLLTTPALIGVVVLVLLFGVAGPRLRLESAAGRKLRALWTGVLRAASPRAPGPRTPAPAVAPEPDAGPPRARIVPVGAGARAGAIAWTSASRLEPSLSPRHGGWCSSASWATCGWGEKPSTSPSSTRCCSAAMRTGNRTTAP